MSLFQQDGKRDGKKIEPTHFSELDVKTMKIQELRDQLDARNLSSKGTLCSFNLKGFCYGENEKIFECPNPLGLKPQLVARLSKVLKTEESEPISVEIQNESNIDEPEAQTGSNSSNEINDCASNDSMDIDMADIVVIDEYDSTKADKSESRSKRVSLFDTYYIVKKLN